jgi:hypothetical protein
MQWFESETIRRAIEGDQAAGLEALRLASNGLRFRRLSPELADYLADRLDRVGEAVDRASKTAKLKRGSAHAEKQTFLADALLINRPAFKPKNPFPDWEQPLAAMGIFLQLKGARPERVKLAMSMARERSEGKNLDRSDAGKVLKKYAPMRELDDELLLHLMGDLRDLVLDFLPQT